MEEIEIFESKPWYHKLKTMPASYYLVAINILVFLILHALRFAYDDHVIVSNFAKNTHDIAMNKEYYRFFTPIFIHEGLSHLFFNCMAIVYLSKPVEAIFSKSKFIIIFILAGLFGSLASFIFSAAPSIGASGGVFGIFGVHMYLYLKYKTKYLKIFGKSMLELLAFNVIIGFMIPNIDYWGHFGGVLGGFFAACVVGATSTYTFKKQNLAMGLVTLLVFFGAFTYTNHQYVSYTTDVQNMTDDFNRSFETKDLDLFNKAVEEYYNLSDKKPLLPPTPYAQHFMTQIEIIVNQNSPK